jgi:hypothetical protein
MHRTAAAQHNFWRSDELKDTSLGLHFDVLDTGREEIYDFQSDSSSVARIYEVDDLFQKYQFAKILCESAEIDRLRAAFIEATSFLNCGIFSDFQRPHVGVDEYGEFSFSIRSSRGYLDVGVCGTGEISYHIRNDLEPEKTKFGDTVWDRVSPPSDLTESAIELLHE